MSWCGMMCRVALGCDILRCGMMCCVVMCCDSMYLCGIMLYCGVGWGGVW